MSPRTTAALHDQVRRHLDLRLRRAALLWLGAGGVGLLLVAWLLGGSDGWRPGSPLPLALDVLAVAALVAAGARFRSLRRQTLEERRVSSTMEEAMGLEPGLVQSSLELQRSVPVGVSLALAGRAGHTVAGRLDVPPETLAGELGRGLRKVSRRGLGTLAVLGPLVVLLTLLAPQRSLLAWRGLSSPVGVLRGPDLPALDLQPGSVEVPRGEPVRIRVSAPLRSRVVLHWQAAGDVARSRTLEVDADTTGFDFDEVAATTEYWVDAPDGARSPVYVLTPVDPLFVSDVTVRVTYPAYLERPDDEFRGDVPPLVLPAGSGLGIEGQANRPLSAAALTGPETGTAGPAVADFAVQGAGFSGSFRPAAAGAYTWRFLDLAGAPAVLTPAPLELTLVRDSLPTVTIALPAADTTLPTNLLQPMVIQAQDDHGLRDLELVAWRVTALGDSLEPVRQQVELGGSPAVLARPLLDVSEWGLLPGDEVRFFARVRDIHPSGQSGRTGVRTLRMPRPEELRQEAQSQLEAAAERLRALQDEAARQAEETRNLERAAQAPDRRGEENRFRPGEEADGQSFGELEELRSAIQEQQALAAEADSLGREMGALSEALQNAGAADPALTQELEELERLMSEVGGDEVEAELDALMERLGEMDARETREALEELTRSQEEAREQLEEALERARRAAVEQDFRNAFETAEALAEEQELLAQALEQGDDPQRRADQQEALEAKAGEQLERMERLGERLQALEERDAAAQLREARQSTYEAQRQMAEAGQQMRQGEPQAGEEAGEAAQKLSEAAQELQQAQQRMMQERAQAFQTALEQTAGDALALAAEQGRIRRELAASSTDEAADLRGDVVAVQQGVRNLAENLNMAARVAGADDRELLVGMGRAMESLEGTLQNMGRAGQPAPVAAAEQSVASLNQVAQTALAAIQALQEGGQAGAPTPEQMMEQLEQLAQEQADVNNQASQVMPMELSPQMLEQQMQQMAQQQQQVASDLGQMSEQEGEEGPMGDLEAMAQEAQALAEALAGGRLDRDTRERQERLFHRLLDAGRSLEREEETTERESAAPGAFDAGSARPLTAGDLNLLRFTLPGADDLNALPPAARALVLRYFQRLNQPPPDGGRR